MIINIRGGVSGWVEYVRRNRDDELVEEIGNLDLTKKIYSKLKYKQKYTKVLIRFDGKVDNETLKKAFDDFKLLYLKDAGLDDDEVNISGMIHQDTKHSHIHICIPEVNLKTNTKLTVYNDKRLSKDKERLMLIQDVLTKKYKDRDARDPANAKKKTFSKVDYFNQQRKLLQKDRKLIPYKDRSKVLDLYTHRMEEMIEAGNISSHEQILEFFESMNTKVVKRGYDEYDKYHFITLEKEEKGKKKKLKLKGDIFAKDYNFQVVAPAKSEERIYKVDMDASLAQLEKLNKKKKEYHASRYKNQEKYAQQVANEAKLKKLKALDKKLEKIASTNISVKNFKQHIAQIDLMREVRIKQKLDDMDIVLNRIKPLEISPKKVKAVQNTIEVKKMEKTLKIERKLNSFDALVEKIKSIPISIKNFKNKLLNKELYNGHVNRKIHETDKHLRTAERKAIESNKHLREAERSFNRTKQVIGQGQPATKRITKRIKRRKSGLNQSVKSIAKSIRRFKQFMATTKSNIGGKDEKARGRFIVKLDELRDRVFENIGISKDQYERTNKRRMEETKEELSERHWIHKQVNRYSDDDIKKMNDQISDMAREALKDGSNIPIIKPDKHDR